MWLLQKVPLEEPLLFLKREKTTTKNKLLLQLAVQILMVELTSPLLGALEPSPSYELGQICISSFSKQFETLTAIVGVRKNKPSFTLFAASLVYSPLSEEARELSEKKSLQLLKPYRQ